ncbi:MAG: sugar phosphate isomerase/epimerase family protein [Eubacteriales bacterium]|nr:sugar phosphate isomerase/epimerase family protein [Eubacteriales bacterium]
MKYGIYYAYWEHEWKGNFIPYVKKVKELGFDVLEVACGGFYLEDKETFKELKKAADDHGIILTGGYGPRPEHNLASEDKEAVDSTFAFYKDMFEKMEIAGIDRIGGALYSYWPVNFSAGFDKKADFERSVSGMQKLADMAADYNVTLCMESLNRFEGYLINTAEEDLEYVKAVDKPNVKCMLDTFHMNIEEDTFEDAIKTTGDLLGHFHVGEANRKPPYAEGRMPWESIGKALKEVNYNGYIVMEPFVLQGGQVGKDISIWRDISCGATEAQLDKAAADSVSYLRELWG